MGGASDAPQDRSESVGIDQFYRLHVAWRQPVALRDEPTERLVDQTGGVVIAAAERLAVVATDEGRVAGIALADGRVRWTRDFPGGVRVRPTLHGRKVLIATMAGDIELLDVSTGTSAGRIALGEPLVTSVVAHGNRAAVISSRNTVHVIDLERRRALWSHVQRVALDVRMRGAAAPAVTDDGVWAAFADGALVHFSPTGDIVWMRDLAEGQRRLRDAMSRVIVRDGVVYASSFTGGLHALDARSGVRVWRLDIEGAAPPVFVDDRTLMTVSADGRVFWVDIAGGRVLRELALEHPVAGVLQQAGPFVAVAGRAGGLALLDPHHPWVHQRYNPGDGVSAPVGAADNLLVVLSNRGIAYGVRVDRAGSLR